MHTSSHAHLTRVPTYSEYTHAHISTARKFAPTRFVSPLVECCFPKGGKGGDVPFEVAGQRVLHLALRSAESLHLLERQRWPRRLGASMLGDLAHRSLPLLPLAGARTSLSRCRTPARTRRRKRPSGGRCRAHRRRPLRGVLGRHFRPVQRARVREGRWWAPRYFVKSLGASLPAVNSPSVNDHRLLQVYEILRPCVCAFSGIAIPGTYNPRVLEYVPLKARGASSSQPVGSDSGRDTARASEAERVGGTRVRTYVRTRVRTAGVRRKLTTIKKRGQ
jgi:hypothetical protein